MNKQALPLIILLSLIAGLLGFNYFSRPFEKTVKVIGESGSEELIVESDWAVEGEKNEVDILLESLSPEQKVNQLIAYPLNLSTLKTQETSEQSSASATMATKSADLEIKDQRLEISSFGFITIFGTNISQQQVVELKDKLSPPSLPRWQAGSVLRPFVAVDHEGGSVQRLSGTGFTRLPSWQEFCSLEANKRQELLASSAVELSRAGIKIIFAPTVDVGASKVLGNRLCSSDPQIVSQRASEFITIFSKQGILPVIKHFPGIGQISRDLHSNFDRISVSSESATVFRDVLTKFPEIGVMVAHVGVTNQYPDIPCSLSAACVGELKNNFPTTLIFSDALDMNSARFNTAQENKDLSQISLEAVQAGIEVLVYGQAVDESQLLEVQNSLVAKYQADEAFAAKVDEAALKIIKFKLHE